MLTVAYIGFGVSAREYHIPYVENREDIKVKYVYRRDRISRRMRRMRRFILRLFSRLIWIRCCVMAK